MAAKLWKGGEPRNMDQPIFDELQRLHRTQGPQAAVEHLITFLRARRDFASLFYALLMKARQELGVSPIPTGAAKELPEAVHLPYEEAIRTLFAGDVAAFYERIAAWPPDIAAYLRDLAAPLGEP